LSFQGAIIALNSLKKKGVIKDYTIAGGFATSYYLEPAYTYDLDIIVLLDNDEDFHALWEYFRQQGNKKERDYIYIDNFPVQFFPSFIGGLFTNAIRNARRVEVRGAKTKVVTVEYLIALLLKAFRPKDKIRIVELLNLADRKLLKGVLGGCDEAELLQARLNKLLTAI
jgi:predicted nucleotidyltransferase